jgi:hypothetical protein
LVSSTSQSLSRGLKRWGANKGPPMHSKKELSSTYAKAARISSSSSIKSKIYGSSSFRVLSFPRAIEIVDRFWTALILYYCI